MRATLELLGMIHDYLGFQEIKMEVAARNAELTNAVNDKARMTNDERSQNDQMTKG